MSDTPVNAQDIQQRAIVDLGRAAANFIETELPKMQHAFAMMGQAFVAFGESSQNATSCLVKLRRQMRKDIADKLRRVRTDQNTRRYLALRRRYWMLRGKGWKPFDALMEPEVHRRWTT